MKFKVKDMDIATGGVMIALLNKKDAQKLDMHSGDRILVHDGKGEVTCILDISGNDRQVPLGSIGLFQEALQKLNVKRGHIVTIRFTGKPESVSHIRARLMGERLTYKEFLHICQDITDDRLTDIEKSYFVAGCFTNKLSDDEIVELTKAMVDTGKKLHFSKMTLDKHCIGGVPGNRTTMLVIPIIAAAGFTIPKTSSRAITSPAGTADTMECLAKVELPEEKIKQVVKKTGACIVHGGSMSLAPADDKIIEVEHPLSIDAEGQMLASVMAKKFSVGATHVLIDIPKGKGTKAKTYRQAYYLRYMFKRIGKELGMKVEVAITDGSQPIGRGVGPLLEAEDVMSVLRNDPSAPLDLKEKAIHMAGLLLEMTGKHHYGKRKAREILESGQALQKMEQIITTQGKQEPIQKGMYNFVVGALRSGIVSDIDNEIIAKIARMAGAPADKGAGIYLYKKRGDKVQEHGPLYTVYAENETKLELVKKLIKEEGNGYRVR